MASSQELVIRILGDTAEFVKSIEHASSAFEQFSKSAEAAGDASFGAVSKALSWKKSIGTGFLITSGVIAAGMAAIAYKGAEAAIELEKVALKLDVFSGSVGDARDAFEFVDKFEFKSAFNQVDIGNAFARIKSAGGDAKESLASIQDAAIATGSSMEGVAGSVASAIVGHYRALRSYDIKSLTEDGQVYFQYFDRNGQEMVHQVEAGNKAMMASTVQMIFNDKYSGAFQMYSQTWDGIMHHLSVQADDVFEHIGGLFLPILKQIMAFSVLDIWEGWSDSTKDFAVSVGLVGGAFLVATTAFAGFLLLLSFATGTLGFMAAALGAVIAGLAAMGVAEVVLAPLVAATSSLIAAQNVLLTIMNILFAPLTLVILAVAAAAAILYAAWHFNFLGIQDVTYKFLDTMTAVFGEIKRRFLQVWDIIGPYVMAVINAIENHFLVQLNRMAAEWSIVKGAAIKVWQAVGDFIGGIIDWVSDKFTAIFGTDGKVMSTLKSWWAAASGMFSAAAKFMGDEWEESVNRINASLMIADRNTTLTYAHIAAMDASKISTERQISDLKTLLDAEETTYQQRKIIRERLAQLEEELASGRTPTTPTGIKMPTAGDEEDGGANAAKKMFNAQAAIDEARIAAMQEGLAKQLATTQRAYDTDIANFKASEEQKLEDFKGSAAERAALEATTTDEIATYTALRTQQMTNEVGTIRHDAERAYFDEAFAQAQADDELTYSNKLANLQMYQEQVLGAETLTEEEKLALITQSNEAIAALNMEHFALLTQFSDQFFSGMQQSMSTALVGMMSGAMTFQEAMKQMWQGIAQAFFKTIADMLTMWIINKLKEFIIGKVTAIGQIHANAAVASAATYASISAIPIVGPPAAPAAASAAYANVMAMTGLVAAAEGGVFTAATLGLVGEAGAEAVIPLDRLPEMMSRMGGVGDVSGSPSGLTINISAIDAENMERVVHQRIVPALEESQRMGRYSV